MLFKRTKFSLPLSRFKKVSEEIEDFDHVIKSIERKIQQYKPTTFCHNDLHIKNVVKTDKGIKIIDFDQAGYGYRYVIPRFYEHTNKLIQFSTLKWLISCL